MPRSNLATKRLALESTLRVPDVAFTRSGIAFQPSAEVWDWTDGPFHLRIDFNRVKGQFAPLRKPLKACLLVYAKGYSSHYLQNLFQAFQHFTTSRNQAQPFSTINVSEVSNYAAALDPAQAWRLVTLNALLQRWSALGLPGVDDECAAYLGERRKPGGEKGAAVRTRDPVHGPFSAAEFTSLYRSIDAAYGTGEIPLWLAVLARLMFACGGRISQYASLKLEDLITEAHPFVLRLPQVKTGMPLNRPGDRGGPLG